MQRWKSITRRHLWTRPDAATSPIEAMTGFFSASTRSSLHIKSDARASPPAYAVEAPYEIILKLQCRYQLQRLASPIANPMDTSHIHSKATPGLHRCMCFAAKSQSKNSACLHAGCGSSHATNLCANMGIIMDPFI